MRSDTPADDGLTVTVKTAARMLDLSIATTSGLLDRKAIRSGYTDTGRRLVELKSLRDYVENLPTERPRDGAA